MDVDLDGDAFLGVDFDGGGFVDLILSDGFVDVDLDGDAFCGYGLWLRRFWGCGLWCR